MTFSQYPYERLDGDALLARLSELTRRLQAASDASEQLELLAEHDALLNGYQTTSTIANIRNTIDTRDDFYEAERKYYDDFEPFFGEKEQEWGRALATSRFRPELEKKLGSLLFLNLEMELKSFSPALIPLMQEENALCAGYQKLYASAQVPFEGKVCTIAQLAAYKENPDRARRKAAYEAEGAWFDEHRAEFDDIFDKLVKNRTEQAHKLGMKSFVELGYLRRQRNCYGPAETASFRRQVEADIVPLVQEIRATQARRIGVEDYRLYDMAYCFPDGNPAPQGTPEEIMAAGVRMYTEMSPETAEFIQFMTEHDLFSVLATEGKAPGGYCTWMPDYLAPFIFSNFNGTSGDVDVLTHEAGHAFAARTALLDKTIPRALKYPTMEAAETHSMSMEFLTAPWHELFFREQTPKYELAHAEDALIFLPYGCEVDHFQELCYQNPDMTPEERNQTWARLERQYRPYANSEGLPFYGRGAGWQRQLHIYLYPFYYVDYCMAQTVALQFWAESRKDHAAAWAKYLAFVRLGGAKTFVELVKSAGLLSPLDDGALKSVADSSRRWLQARG